MVIRWTEKAKRQLKEIIQFYINEEAFRTVENLQEEINSAVSLLAAFPNLGHLEEDLKRNKYIHRSIIIRKHYKIIYTLITEEIIITAFWDVRQDPEILYNSL